MIVKGYGIWIEDSIRRLNYLNYQFPIDLEEYDNIEQFAQEYGIIGTIHYILNSNVQMFEYDYSVHGDALGFYLLINGDFLRDFKCNEIDSPPDNRTLLKFLNTCKKIGITIKKKDIKFVEFDTLKDDWLK